MAAKKWDSNKEIDYFREYLRIPSVHPNPDYGRYQGDFILLVNKESLKLYLCQHPAWSF